MYVDTFNVGNKCEAKHNPRYEAGVDEVQLRC